MTTYLTNIKERVITLCGEKLESSCANYRTQLAALKISLESESKSSAGDKHETGRAMVQLEMERLSARLKIAEDELNSFRRLAFNDAKNRGTVTPGTLVETDKGLYFLAVSLGMVKVGETPVAVVSSASPIGGVLKGKAAGEQILFNGVAQTIKAIR
ncbi:3-oxoacyl-ACP synthase [Robertkochia marina]|uniref:3-oxoacyl-ACP synthase n=1 Tax=Robertkochia marina TaxID=1227945 RepID=A0A4S3M289_9FLAO|nr:3-oxoacyl-ACP synthase [Robertkochia marina]THD69234.1 3-oxoacyl-ACP synthase [Robertkochia marina]TRZ47507.1 3-oxoacyl-ACP synthase [Robertkochia marina]